MTIETSTYISELNTAYPEAGSAFSDGDDHLRKIKANIKATFPNFTAIACTPSSVEFNYLTGVTSAIQTQFAGKAGTLSPAFTGTPTAPTAVAGTNNTQIATTAFAFRVAGEYAAEAVGTYVFAQSSAVGNAFGTGGIPGSSLTPVQINSGGTQTTNGVTLSGTWRCMGYNLNSTTASLYLRIA